MGWTSEDPKHDGYLIGYVVREGVTPGDGLLRECMYPKDDQPCLLLAISAGCDCGWRSGRWVPLKPAEWFPHVVDASEEDEERGLAAWHRHLHQEGVERGALGDRTGLCSRCEQPLLDALAKGPAHVPSEKQAAPTAETTARGDALRRAGYPEAARLADSEEVMDGFSTDELALLQAAARRRGLTLQKLVARYRHDEPCPVCGGSHRSCPHSSPCLGHCGRRTTPYESCAPGYCLFCAADTRGVVATFNEAGRHSDDCPCGECYERREGKKSPVRTKLPDLRLVPPPSTPVIPMTTSPFSRIGGPLQLRREGSGPRHYLEGKPVHAGTTLELSLAPDSITCAFSDPDPVWLRGRYEWSYEPEERPHFYIDLGDGRRAPPREDEDASVDTVALRLPPTAILRWPSKD